MGNFVYVNFEKALSFGNHESIPECTFSIINEVVLSIECRYSSECPLFFMANLV